MNLWKGSWTASKFIVRNSNPLISRGCDAGGSGTCYDSEASIQHITAMCGDEDEIVNLDKTTQTETTKRVIKCH